MFNIIQYALQLQHAIIQLCKLVFRWMQFAHAPTHSNTRILSAVMFFVLRTPCAVHTFILSA